MPTIVNERAALRPTIYKSNGPAINLSQNAFELNRLVAMLFNRNEQGFFYDPSDLSTMFQDAEVTTAGQPVGLILDKSKGLAVGPELVDISKWVARSNTAITVTGNKVRISAIADGAWGADLNYTTPTISGKRYKVLFNLVTSDLTPSLHARFTTGSATIYGAGTHTLVELSTGATAAAIASTSGKAGAYVEAELSVVELPVNHAYQTTSAARPILRQAPILGSELIQDTEFNVPAYWTASAGTVNVSGGFANFVGAATGSNINSTGRIALGKTYQLTFTISAISSGSIRPAISLGTGTTPLANYNKVGTYTVIAVASGTVPAIQLTAIGTTDATVDNISVKEVTGYRTDQIYIEYDGVDDKLITNLPAPLTNATVLRAIPNVGTQVKYNQTLPTLYEDSTNHAGLIAIDRALTRQEQLRLMTELDKKAGVTSLDASVVTLFDNNQEGVVYDPNDLSTLFQDAAGTVPVSGAGQPVGLVLDKSKQLQRGVNLTNDFDFRTWSVLSGAITEKSSFTVVSGGGVTSNVGMVAGKMYKIDIEYTTTNPTSAVGLLNGNHGGSPILASTTSGKISCYCLAANALLYLRTGAATVTVTKFVVQEVFGNHAYQTTSASRPILRKNAVTGANYLAFDGVDDFMVTVPLNLAGKKELTIHTGFLALPTALTYEYLLANGSGTNDSGLIRLRAGDPTSQKFEVNSGTYVSVDGPSAATRPEKRVLCAKFSSIAPYHSFTVNGVTSQKVIPATKDTTLSTLPMYIGRQNTNSWHATMELYGLIIVSTITSEAFDRRTKLDYENKMGF